MKTLRTWTLATCCCIGSILLAQEPSYSTQEILKDLEFFNGWEAAQLAPNFKKKQLTNFRSPLMRQLAKSMIEGNYQKEYRLKTYRPIASNKILQNKLKLSDGYSRYENITGMYLERGENVVLVGDMHGRKINLLIPDWMRQPTPGFAPTKDPEGWELKKQVIALHEGVNVIHVEKAGNVYIDYFADDPETAPGVTIHFVTGKVNGYFDAETQTNKDWNKLLDQAVSPVMDVKTRYIQLDYPV